MRMHVVGAAMLLGVLVGCSASHQSLRCQKFHLSDDAAYQPLLTGPPQTAGMRSGRVVLIRGQITPEHSTKAHEEVLVFLQGRAKVAIRGREPIEIGAGEVLYIPPQTSHEVRNAGPDEVRYIYTVAPIRE